VAGVVLFAAFLLFERRARHPMVSLDLFKSRNFSVANGACLSLYAGLSAALFFIVIYVQQVAGYSALEAGLALMPLTVVMFLFSRRFGALADRFGPRPLMSVGPLVAGAGLLLTLSLGREADYLTSLGPAIVLFGLGLSMTVSPLTSTVLGAVEDVHAGVASGINNAVSRVAGLIAVAALGAIVSAQFAATMDDGLAGQQLDAESRGAVTAAKGQPLAGSVSLPGGEAALLGPAVDDAAIAGFQLGMGIAALLVAGGGVVSWLWIHDPRPTLAPHRPAKLAPSCEPQPHPAPVGTPRGTVAASFQEGERRASPSGAPT
jgi:Major Facilitator Superfamily